VAAAEVRLSLVISRPRCGVNMIGEEEHALGVQQLVEPARQVSGEMPVPAFDARMDRIGAQLCTAVVW
jgi:hypothetical protein